MTCKKKKKSNKYYSSESDTKNNQLFTGIFRLIDQDWWQLQTQKKAHKFCWILTLFGKEVLAHEGRLKKKKKSVNTSIYEFNVNN